MKKIFAIIALFFAFASTSAVAKNDYSCDKKFIFFPGGPEVVHLELLFITVL